MEQAKGSRSINRYGKDAGVDPGYISRLLRTKIDRAPSAMIIKKLAAAAEIEINAQKLLAAAGYIDDYHVRDKQLPAQTFPQWEKVIEEAARYEISPDVAADLIRSLGISMEKMKKKPPS